jgi:hypothetical protein
VKFGKLAFDLEDDFIKLLLRNTDRLSSDLRVQRAVRDYFVLMVYDLLRPSADAEDQLEMKEREVMALLGTSEDLRPAAERRGDICLVVLGVRARFMENRNIISFVTEESLADSQNQKTLTAQLPRK